MPCTGSLSRGVPVTKPEDAKVFMFALNAFDVPVIGFFSRARRIQNFGNAEVRQYLTRIYNTVSEFGNVI